MMRSRLPNRKKLRMGFFVILSGFSLCIAIIALGYPIAIALAHPDPGCVYQGNQNADSDGDGFSDGYEMRTNSNLCDPCSPDQNTPACSGHRQRFPGTG